MSHPNQKHHLLFWSGGKDSLLALRYLQDDGIREPLLLTTFDDESARVPHQNIPVENIRKQAISLGLTLFTVPLSYPASNTEYLNALQNSFSQIPFGIESIVFGDLHLHDIRNWRQSEFGNKMGYTLQFPIWKKPYDELFSRLEKEEAEIRISSVMDQYRNRIKPGDLFNRKFAESLPDHIDPMGENGEFHTEVIFT